MDAWVQDKRLRALAAIHGGLGPIPFLKLLIYLKVSPLAAAALGAAMLLRCDLL